MRALLALLMGCAPTKKTAPDSDASTEPPKGAKQKVAKPAKRGAGTVPQAVKQAAAINHEDAQRIAKEAAAAVAAAEPLKLKEDDEWWRDKGGADLESALQVDPDHGDSPVALIDARYIVELWKRGGKILRRQDLPKEAFIDLETVKRLPETATAAACASSPSRTRGSSPTTRTRRRSTSRCSPRYSSGLSRAEG